MKLKGPQVSTLGGTYNSPLSKKIGVLMPTDATNNRDI